MNIKNLKLFAQILSLGLLGSVVFATTQEVVAQQSYQNFTHYTSVKRGSVIEDMFIQKDSILALQKGENLPNGTQIVMEEYRNNSGQKGQLTRIITMSKINDDWAFEAFNANKTPNRAENTQRCYDCHRSSIGGADIVFTLDKIKAFRLDR